MEDDDMMETLDKIPDSTQRLLLKNYYSMLNMSDDDPISSLLQPDNIGLGVQQEEDWSTLYSY